jgi:hypothetical protein
MSSCAGFPVFARCRKRYGRAREKQEHDREPKREEKRRGPGYWNTTGRRRIREGVLVLSGKEESWIRTRARLFWNSG